MDESQEITVPKAFISYSWGTDEHNEWVSQLARELRENFGVDVVFDRWDLKENDDKYEFMERAVTDPAIQKVLMICDKKYQEKADSREGGVGTETQIISSEIYEKIKSDQEKRHKFCAIIKERDANGNAYIPTYLKSRIYIDMSSEELRDQSLEQLIRWIFDKPFEKKPALGKPPAFLHEDEKISLRTSSLFRLATSAVKQDKPNAFGIVRDYLETFSENFEELRIEPIPDKNFDDQVINSIESFLQYRDEFLDLVATVIRYSRNDDYVLEIGAFFERVLPYLFIPISAVRERSERETDNFRFIIRELFLLTIALLLKNQKFIWANDLLIKDYYMPVIISEFNDSRLYPYLVINQFVKSFEVRGQLLGVNENAELLRQRANRKDISLEDIMQADLVLYLRDELLMFRGASWFPYSLLLFPYRPFELFLRAESKRFFAVLKVVLGIEDKESLGTFLAKYEKNEIRPIAVNNFHKVELTILTNFDHLATKA